jgi:hypothetical protein
MMVPVAEGAGRIGRHRRQDDACRCLAVRMDDAMDEPDRLCQQHRQHQQRKERPVQSSLPAKKNEHDGLVYFRVIGDASERR